MIAGPATTAEPRPGVLDLYRELGTSLFRGWSRAAPLIEGTVILSWFVLRTVDAGPVGMWLWVAVTVVLAVIAPTSGLVILAAIAPFNEGFLLTRDIGVKSLFALLIVGSIGVRIALGWRGRREWRRPSASVILAAFLLLSTGAGLAITRLRFGHDFFNNAWQIWFTGVATMFLVFLAAVWVARRGDLRPLVVACIAATVGGLVSLVEFAAPEAFRASLATWVVSGPPIARLTGVIARSPTSTAALVMLPAIICLAAVFAGRHRRDLLLRVGAGVVAIVLLVAAYYTYNRAVYLALFALAIVIAWRVRPRYGIALAAVGFLIGLALLPGYMELRGAGAGVLPEPGQVLLANDRQRLEAWAASVRMFVDQPIIGHGYRSYREVSPAFGGTVLNAPHNEWLRLFAEHGLFVGLAGLAFVVATVRELWRVPGWLGAGILGAFLSFALAAAFNNPFLFNQVTIPASIIAGTGVAIAGLARSRAGAETEPAILAAEPADEP